MILSKPNCGWCEVNIGNFTGNASYLTDVPVELLENLIEHFRNRNKSLVLKFDEEGSEFIIVLSSDEIYTISHRNELNVYYSDMSDKEFAMEIIYDIESNFEDWVEWLCYKPKEEQRELELKSLLNYLKRLINIS